MISDKQRVELTLAPMLLLDVIQSGTIDPATPDAVAAKTHLVIATTEVVQDLTPKERDKILRRSRRAFDDATAPYRKAGASVAKMGLIAFYWLQTLVSARYFVLREDAPLMKALDLLLPALEPAANVAKLDSSARKQADHLMRRLQELGYFREVHPSSAGAE